VPPCPNSTTPPETLPSNTANWLELAAGRRLFCWDAVSDDGATLTEEYDGAPEELIEYAKDTVY
jgi:hypothetical protein